MTHKSVSKLAIIGLDNGLSPDRRQAIIWTNAGILLLGPIGTNFSEILIEINTFSFKKKRLKMSSGKWRPFCLGLNVLNPVRIHYTRMFLSHMAVYLLSGGVEGHNTQWQRLKQSMYNCFILLQTRAITTRLDTVPNLPAIGNVAFNWKLRCYQLDILLFCVYDISPCLYMSEMASGNQIIARLDSIIP